MSGSTLSSSALDERRRRILFRAWRRGVREMDLVMGRFADAHLPAMSEADLAEFERLLDVPDPQVFAWIMGGEPPMIQAKTCGSGTSSRRSNSARSASLMAGKWASANRPMTRSISRTPRRQARNRIRRRRSSSAELLKVEPDMMDLHKRHLAQRRHGRT